MRKLNQKGSILIFVTLAFALLGTFIGFAVDFGRAYLQKARISRLVDGAALAAAKALKGQAGLEPEATRAACDSMVMNGAPVAISGNGCAATTGADFTVAVSFVDKPAPGGVDIKYVQVRGDEPMPTTFLKFLGWLTPGDFSTIPVSALAEAGPERPIDLMLVLDRSGSMQAVDGSGTPKSTALKIATNAFLDKNFTSDDHVGMTSFAYRGCAGPTPTGDSIANGDCSPDQSLGSSISSIKTAVNSLVFNNGSTNTMEGLRVGNTQITNAINDPTRSASRKAVVLITDGRPTSSRRFGSTQCNQDPISGSGLGISSPPNNCIHSVFTNGQNEMYWNPLNPPVSPGFTGNNQIASSTGYKNSVRYARQTAVSEADTIRNLASKSVLIYVVAIGKVDPVWGNSLDANSKCLLGRIANDPNTVGANCPNIFTTGDGDTYPDLQPCKADPTSCIDNTQQKGRMFTIDLTGNVQQQLNAVFDEIALLLKLRLTI